MLITVEEIVQAYLIEHNIDGLCNEDCGCGVGDLAPCGSIRGDCEIADKVWHYSGCEYVPCDDREG